MMKSLSFPDLMAELLGHFSLPVPSGLTKEVYTLHFDGQPDIHFVGKNGVNYIDVMTEAGQLRNLQAAESLLALLELNTCGTAEYPATVTVHRASSTVVVWCRQSYAALDLETIKKVLLCIQQQAELVRKQLGKVSTSRPVNTAASLARMIRSKE
jgi:Tir chaperone protein (CesT) family